MFQPLRQLKSSKKLVTLAMSFLIGASFASQNPAFSAEERQLQMPTKLPTPRAKEAPHYTPDLLLVMANPKADNDDVQKALKECNGTIIGTMGEGDLKCYIIRTEKGKLEQTEKKLAKDKNFRTISRNYEFKAQLIPNDANFASEWHLGAINAPRAWDSSMGGGQKVAIFDSGCQANNPDLSGKTLKGYNATSWAARATVLGGPGLLGDLFGGVSGALNGGAQTDVHGHGTLVATTAAATANNSVLGAGVAPTARVYPVRIAGSGGMTDDIAIMAGLLNMMASGNRIVNISYGAYPGIGFTNKYLHGPLHVYMQTFHDVKQGVIFLSAGNDGAFDPFPPQHYYNLVSAVDQSLKLTDFSNWGPGVTFTAPGKDIVCSDRSGATATVDGTSFSAPICASVAALIMNERPYLPAVWVEYILKRSCIRAGSSPWTPYYGWGMPNAERAIKIARNGI